MDNEKAIMFLASVVEKLARSRYGLEHKDWLTLKALKDGDFSVFEDKEEQES